MGTKIRSCATALCRNPRCPDLVEPGAGSRPWAAARWFITLGHPGFNSPANNRNGYATEAGARAASRKYGAR
jgi:hypothetical protein